MQKHGIELPRADGRKEGKPAVAMFARDNGLLLPAERGSAHGPHTGDFIAPPQRFPYVFQLRSELVRKFKHLHFVARYIKPEQYQD